MPEVTSLLVDTHIWYRWRNDSRKLSRAQARVLMLAERRSEPVAVSAISLWELAMLAVRGRIQADRPLDSWLNKMATHSMIDVVPITPEIAAESAQLGIGLSGDPADRLIVATARCLHLRLLTADERIRDWAGVSVL